jgi:hypothetical protein
MTPYTSSVFVQASRCRTKLLAQFIGVGVILGVITVTAVTAVFTAELDFVTLSSLPPEVRDAFEKSPQAKRYQLCAHINPFYLHGDFNGDGRWDTAVLIKERSSGKNGIAIYHGRSNRLIIVGAGQDWGNGSEDFPGLDAWQVFHRGPVGKGADGKAPPKLRGDALMVIKTESASALIYWNGTRYAWYQQGD